MVYGTVTLFSEHTENNIHHDSEQDADENAACYRQVYLDVFALEMKITREVSEPGNLVGKKEQKATRKQYGSCND